MFKRVVIAAMVAFGTLSAVATPATAAVVTIQNGDFTGARDATGPNIGNLVPTPFGFGYGSYTTNFAWSASGCGCNNAIASYPGLITGLFAPGAPAGYAGNIYALDAAPGLADGVFLHQLINGLTLGSRYSVSFLQASGSKYVTGGDTAQWHIGLGGVVNDPTMYNPYPTLVGATVKDAPLMTNGVGTGFSGWTREYATFTAGGTSQLLSFFATGSGAPPYALLADVSISAVPEPATWAMMIIGFGVVGGAMRAAKRRSDETFDAKIKRIAEGEAA